MNKTMTKQLTNKPNLSPLIGRKFNLLFSWFVHYFYQGNTKCMGWGTEYISLLNKMSNQRGKRATLKYAKDMRLCVTRYLAGTPFSPGDIKVKLNKVGLPEKIYFLHSWIMSKEVDKLRYVFTMLNLTRSVKLEPIEDYAPITDSWGGQLPTLWHTSLPVISHRANIRKSKYKWKGTHISTKSGPNGQAMLFSLWDIVHLPDDLKQAIRELGGKTFREQFDKILSDVDGKPVYQHWNEALKLTKSKGLVRKLSSFGDKEGKTRVIGILDYWSQSVLIPIHDRLEKILSRIKEDCTFDQGAWYNKLPKDCVYYSFDLTNATDRLPVAMQETIIEFIFSKRVASAWRTIISYGPFTSKDCNVSYGTGQPMGAYSSWPIMALQHHLIVRYAAHLAKVSPKGKYVILGDDVVIGDDRIAKEYKQIMATLDVPISSAKTHISRDICEFAKRWYFKGSEISPFPLHSLAENCKRYYLLQNSIEDAEKKGFILEESAKRGAITELFQINGKKHQASRTVKLFELFDGLMKVKSSPDDIKLQEISNIISRNWDLTEVQKLNLVEPTFQKIWELALNEIAKQEKARVTTELQKIVEIKKTWFTPALWDQLKNLHPCVIAFNRCLTEMSKRMANMFSRMNTAWVFRKGLSLFIDFPLVSFKIINMRRSHLLLAQQSRLVKWLIHFSKVGIPPKVVIPPKPVTK